MLKLYTILLGFRFASLVGAQGNEEESCVVLESQNHPSQSEIAKNDNYADCEAGACYECGEKEMCQEICAGSDDCVGFWVYDTGRCCLKSSWSSDFSQHVSQAGAFYSMESCGGCDELNSWDGNSCYSRVTDYNGVSIQKSSSFAGSESAWIQAFSTDEYASIVHMDGARVGDFFEMTFPSAMVMNGFRFECGGNGDGRNIEQNVFDVEYLSEQHQWIVAGTTDSADGHCKATDTPGYATWEESHPATKWRIMLTEQHGGPWYHGFAWYTGSGNLAATTTTTTSPAPLRCGVFSCGDDAMLKPLMNIEVGSSFEECCECSYAASNHAFLGMFMKGEFDNQSRKLSLSFDLPSDVHIQSVEWNGASDDSLSYAQGLWTSSNVNQCRNTYVLNEGLAQIFGSGSLFSLTGTTLTTSIRVEATSHITEDGSSFERTYSEDIPILVGLETETTVQATFHMTITDGEYVHITGNAEHFATDGSVKLTMMVTTPGCIQNSASIASGMEHLTDPEFTFGESKLVDNMCEQQVELTFDPIEEFSDEISIQFTSRQGDSFSVEVDVNIQAGSILDYLPFDAVMTFHADSTFNDDPQSEFLLGDEVYAKIELSPLVNLPLSSITVNSFTLTQTGYSGELETTDLMNEGWAGFTYTATPEQNEITVEFELESTHFHVTEEGELCEIDTDISITYQDGTTVRRQLSMRRRLTEQHVSNGFAIKEASEAMVAGTWKRKTSINAFLVLAMFTAFSYLIFRTFAPKREEYSSLLTEYEEF